jgi:hypothetical protein
VLVDESPRMHSIEDVKTTLETEKLTLSEKLMTAE